MNEATCSTIYLNLSVSVLRKVGILESALYTETYLSGKLFLLEKFFRFTLDLTKYIEENLVIFHKLIQNIKQAWDKYIDDYAPIVLLNAIFDSFNDVKSAIKYGRDGITLDIVINGLKSKELDLKHCRGHTNHSKESGEAFCVRGRSKSRSRYPRKDNQDNPGHFIKDCPVPSQPPHYPMNPSLFEIYKHIPGVNEKVHELLTLRLKIKFFASDLSEHVPKIRINECIFSDFYKESLFRYAFNLKAEESILVYIPNPKAKDRENWRCERRKYLYTDLTHAIWMHMRGHFKIPHDRVHMPQDVLHLVNKTRLGRLYCVAS
ncbi:unnamed protein product [Cuscuta europaea]|uniref:Uncharacterized protein n=1 Tax=Cuscuta europaea TaxID=41803 RepID=A0A9P0ZHQ9_CUSEU|nr:unnamed protein product [Cuscuta europaea]